MRRSKKNTQPSTKRQSPAAARNSGIVLPVIDGLLAATALEHNLTLVTRDTGQIPSMGVAVFNPWQKN